MNAQIPPTIYPTQEQLRSGQTVRTTNGIKFKLIIKGKEGQWYTTAFNDYARIEAVDTYSLAGGGHSSSVIESILDVPTHRHIEYESLVLAFYDGAEELLEDLCGGAAPEFEALNEAGDLGDYIADAIATQLTAAMGKDISWADMETDVLAFLESANSDAKDKAEREAEDWEHFKATHP